MDQKNTYSPSEIRYLKLLAKQYPTVQDAATEIINLQSILDLPKGTEHFISDIHGEHEAFTHIVNSCSGEVKEKLNAQRISFFDFDYKNPVSAEEFDVLIAMYDEALAMSGEVGRQVLEDYLKEKLAYEKTCEACDKELETVLAEHNALFEIDIVSFSPESFYGYVALKDDLDVNSIYPTSLSTISQDTKAALAELKEGR